jgi:hypothetical protein
VRRIFPTLNDRGAGSSRIRSRAWLTSPQTQTILRPLPAVSPWRWHTPQSIVTSGKGETTMRNVCGSGSVTGNLWSGGTDCRAAPNR